MAPKALAFASALLLSGCIIVHQIEPKFDKDGTVNINIRTDSDDPNVNVAVDDVMMTWDELKALMEMKKTGKPPAEAKAPSAAASPSAPAAAPAAAEAPAEAEAAPPPTAAGPMTHSVQVGAYLVPQNAREQAAALSARGYPAGILTVEDAKGRTWHLVRIGDFPSAEAAQARAAEFSRSERIPAAVRPYGRF